jgi:hypothetical protein
VYFGTDTRASTMLIGAALAIIWSPWRLTRDTGRKAPLALDVMAVIGALGVVWFFLNAGELDTWMYRGGFLVVALFSAMLIAATVHPAARVTPAIFGLKPFLWVGIRSYGIYLWHWPIFMVTRPHADIPLTGIPLLVLRIALTFGAAALSYRYVEEPIRHGALGRWWHTFQRASGERRRRLRTTFAVGGGAIVAGTLVIAAGLAGAEPAGRPAGLPAASSIVFRPDGSTPVPPSSTVTSVGPGGSTTPTASSRPSGSSSTGGQTTTTPPSTTVTLPPTVPARVTAIGDSVMLGAATTMKDTIGDTRLWFDAAESRQFSAGVDTIQALREQGELGDEVVVQLGTNGSINPDDFDRMMNVLKGVKKVILVNAKVPRVWEEQVNDLLAEGVKKYKNAVLVDWHAYASEHPEFFYDDQIHLRPEGAQAYAQLIAGYL